MTANNSEKTKYPLLSQILTIKNLPLQAMYTPRHLAELFDVSVRSVQNWMTSGKLPPRSLPGHWKFLTQDIEDFLEASLESKC